MSDQALLQTVFLYLYDLMGVSRGKKDPQDLGIKTLDILFSKFSDGKKQKKVLVLNKEEQASLSFNLDHSVFIQSFE